MRLLKPAGLSSVGLLLALFALGCSGADDQPAASLLSTDFQLEAPFTEVRPKVRIPMKYTCYAENLSPPLSWSGAPEGTMSYALIGEDLDHSAGLWEHWVIYNIPASVTELAEGISTSTEVLPDGTTQGKNAYKTTGYDGPCPVQIIIPGEGENYNDDTMQEPAHKHRFTLYALDVDLGLAAGENKHKLLKAMDGHILAQAETVGKFQLPVVSGYKKEQGRPVLGGFGGLASSTTSTDP